MSKADYLSLSRTERAAFIAVLNESHRDPNHLTGDAALQHVIQQAKTGGD